MSEYPTPGPLMQQGQSKVWDMDALRAFDEKYPEYAVDPFSGYPDAVSISQKVVQADEGPSNEGLQWVEKNDYFEDQDVASIFENMVEGIESSIVESSIIGNHQVDLSGDTLVPLPNAGVDSQQNFPHDFDSFAQEHWEFYTNHVLNDETMMTKNWDDLVCWLNESWTKFKAEENAAKAAKASEERSRVDHGENNQDSKTAPQGSESRPHLGKGRVQHPMPPPQRNGTHGAAPSPYQNTNVSGLKSHVPSLGNNQHMSNHKTSCHPGIGLENHERLQSSQPEFNGRTRPLQGPVEQAYSPRVQYQQPQGPPIGYSNNSQYKVPPQHQGFVRGINGAPRAQHQQSRGPSIGHTNNSLSTLPAQHQALAQGMNGAPRAQHQQPHDPLVSYINNSQSTQPAQHQGSVQGMNGTPRYQLSTLGPGGRKDREAPKQILGRRGREAIENDDVVELDSSVSNRLAEDWARSKRRRNNANPGTSTEPRPQRRQNGSTSRPQYYGAAGAPVPIGLPEERSGITRPTSGFAGDAVGPYVPRKAIASDRHAVVQNEKTYAPITGASNVAPSPNQRAGHNNLAALKMNGGQSGPRNHSEYLQPTPRAHQAQQIPGKRSREEPVGGLGQGTHSTLQNNGGKGPEGGNGDRHNQAQHGQNSAFGPTQLPTGPVSHIPHGNRSSYPQRTGRVPSEDLDNFGLEPEGDVQPKVSRKRDRSQSMNESQEDSLGPEAKRRRTPGTQGQSLPPGAPRREKPKLRKSKRDGRLPPPVFSIGNSGHNASQIPRGGATGQAEEMIPATSQIPQAAQVPHVANAPGQQPPHRPATAPAGQMRAPDIRDVNPTTEWECARLGKALECTRWAYEQWTGIDAPRTNRVDSYNSQFGVIFKAFDDWWHSGSNPDLMHPMAWLVQLDPWEGGVADWNPPVTDGVFYECVRRGFYAPRNLDGSLQQPDYRHDYQDYPWYSPADEALMM